jgi:hypothetical protein
MVFTAALLTKGVNKMTVLKRMVTLCIIVSIVAPTTVLANMSYTPWVHKMVQKGADVEITVQIFDETTATNDEGDPLPGLDDAYTLGRLSVTESGTVFEDRVFDPGEADEVTEYICHSWSEWYEDAASGGCDEATCNGFCGVAYRYKVMDHCPPFNQEDLYGMSTASGYDLHGVGEGLGFTNGFDVEEEEGDLCGVAQGGDSSVSANCSVNRIGPKSLKILGLFQSILTLILSISTQSE